MDDDGIDRAVLRLRLHGVTLPQLNDERSMRGRVLASQLNETTSIVQRLVIVAVMLQHLITARPALHLAFVGASQNGKNDSGLP